MIGIMCRLDCWMGIDKQDFPLKGFAIWLIYPVLLHSFHQRPHLYFGETLSIHRMFIL